MAYVHAVSDPAFGSRCNGFGAAGPLDGAAGVRGNRSGGLVAALERANAGLGQAMLNAAQLAVFNFADESFELLIHDTKGSPGAATEAASAAIGDGAALILGPLLSASTRAVGAVARAANVPVIAFSSDRSVAGGGTYTMGFLPSAEIWRIVAYARSKGVRRFAALAPDNIYGETVVSALENAVAANGGTVPRVQFYDPNTTDFSVVVRTLANYNSRRQALLGQRKELKGREDEVSRRALKRLAKLQTIGDLPFDALLLAEGGKRLQAIAALLPFYDIDPAKVRMLGTGQWDMPGLGAEPALVGGWFAAPSPAARTDFETTYKETYGRASPRLATLAYDATALAAVLAKAEQGANFSAAAITVTSGFWGRDGIFRFLPSGVAERGLAVMKVGRHGPEVISRAQETFQAAIN
jgi:ABC-type branched-subunit amino acid transport system substrate-binding protein